MRRTAAAPIGVTAQPAMVPCREIRKIQLTLPNLHCLKVDLSPFGQDNPNEIFVFTEEPHGVIEGTLERT